MRRLVLAGPMRQTPDYNRERFARLERHYVALGVEVRWLGNNPALADIFAKRPADITPEDERRCTEVMLEQLLWCTDIVFLKDWQVSTGSTLEHTLATWLGRTIWPEPELGGRDG